MKMNDNYTLIISEKPSVSASIAYCIGATEKISEGNTFYWQGCDCQGNGYIVTNALGHLFGIGTPTPLFLYSLPPPNADAKRRGMLRRVGYDNFVYRIYAGA